MPKRKNDAPPNGSHKPKKRALDDDEAHGNFRAGLFDQRELAAYTSYYAASQPYVAVPRAQLTQRPPTRAPGTSMP